MEQATRFAETVDEIPGVGAAVSGAGDPLVTLHLRNGEIPDEIHRAIRLVGGRIEDAWHHDPDTISIEVRVPGWKDGGSRTVRAIGSSTGLTLPPEALDATGITEDTTVSVHARDGELLLRELEPEVGD